MSKVGRPKKIKNSNQLWEYALAYFEWADNNPWNRVDYRGKDVEKVLIPTPRPYTWAGFSTWLSDNDIIGDVNDYRDNTNGSYSEFSAIITRIRRKMYAQKFEGAAVGAYNANIIARELGLKEQVSQETRNTIVFADDDERSSALDALNDLYEFDKA